MAWNELDYYDKILFIRQIEEFIEHIKLFGTRKCDTCKVKRRARGFSLIKGTCKRKAICKRCEARKRTVARNMDRKARRLKITCKKAEPTALRNPKDYRPILTKKEEKQNAKTNESKLCNVDAA